MEERLISLRSEFAKWLGEREATVSIQRYAMVLRFALCDVGERIPKYLLCCSWDKDSEIERDF